MIVTDPLPSNAVLRGKAGQRMQCGKTALRPAMATAYCHA
jgi:hypothetical protein